jgi:hypothetical protein
MRITDGKNTVRHRTSYGTSHAHEAQSVDEVRRQFTDMLD